MGAISKNNVLFPVSSGENDQLKEKIFVLESCKSELEAEQKRSKEFEETQVGYNFKWIEHRRWL